jgi:hypothetical protein
MKLSTARVRQTIEQLKEQAAFEETVAISDDSPVLPKLATLFGDHTFFLDSEGLHIIEPVEPAAAEAPECQVIKLASWRDASRTALAPQQPELTEIVVVLGPDDEA